MQLVARRRHSLEAALRHLEDERQPTLAEMARIKAWLLETRHTVRDYLDTVVLLERLSEAAVPAAFFGTRSSAWRPMIMIGP